jgi:hypothetical protein
VAPLWWRFQGLRKGRIDKAEIRTTLLIKMELEASSRIKQSICKIIIIIMKMIIELSQRMFLGLYFLMSSVKKDSYF